MQEVINETGFTALPGGLRTYISKHVHRNERFIAQFYGLLFFKARWRMVS